VADHIFAIVVTYNPQRGKLELLLDAIASQVEKVIVVDNGTTSGKSWLTEIGERSGREILALDGNCGVAAGHNLGIARARELGADAVLMLDQDSLPAANMVAELRKALVALSGSGRLVAAVGPAHFDRGGAQSPFLRFGFARNQHLYCGSAPNDEAVQCDHLITSGTLVPINVFGAVGVLEDALFIDNVDTEWCFRAIDKGYSLFGVCAARMSHSVGDALVETWVPYADPVVVHSPIRLYYIFRNHLLLYGRRYTPMRWKLQAAPRLLFKALVFTTSVSPRSTNLSMILEGLRDGARGKTGSYEQR
jgi:rhamnosyltransferase